ncbi:MAG: hypothetical protein ACXV8I_11050 [Methylobacter sp.]
MNYFLRSLAIIALSVTGAAHADAPFIDYQWTPSPDACPERANDAMRDAGFQIVDKGEASVVGIKDDYKGIAACVDKGSSTAVFIVSGSSYEQARRYALSLKNSFIDGLRPK